MKNKNNVSKNSQKFKKATLLELDNEALKELNGGHCEPIRRVHRRTNYMMFY